MSARRLGWWLFVVIALGLVFHPLLFSRAEAMPVFRAESRDGEVMSLRLLEMPCTDEKVLVHLRPALPAAMLARFKAAARLWWGGRPWSSCWIELRGVVHSIDEQGEFLEPVPRERFRDDSV